MTQKLLAEEQPNLVCLASSTFMKTWKKTGGDSLNPDQVRGDLALRSMKLALDRGYRVVIVDGGSSEDFLSEIRNIVDEVTKEKKIPAPVIEKEQDKGYSGSRRQALKLAAKQGAKVIVMMEIEKVSITENVPILVQPILEGKAEVVVPERGIRVNLEKKNRRKLVDGEDFRGYPAYQAYSEVWANKKLNQSFVKANLRKENEPILDLFGGTRVMANNPEVLEDFYLRHDLAVERTKTNPKMYFDAVYAPIAYLLSKGKRILSVSIKYRHPEKQTKIEEVSANFDAKRDSQRRMITAEVREQTRFIRDLKRFLEIDAERYLNDVTSRFAIEGLMPAPKKSQEEVYPDEPIRNGSYKGLRLMRERQISRRELAVYEGRAITEYFLDMDFKLVRSSLAEVNMEQAEKRDFPCVGEKNSVFIVREALKEADLKTIGLEVGTWGRFFFDLRKKQWVLAIDEGSELDSAKLTVDDILQDLQIEIRIKRVPWRDKGKNRWRRILGRLWG